MAHPCIEKIMKLKNAKGVSRKQVEAAVKRMQELMEKTGGDVKEFDRIAKDVLARHRSAALIAAKQAAENLIKAKTEFVLYTQKAYRDDPAEGIVAMLDGSTRLAHNANNSIHMGYLSYQKKYWSVIEAGLDKTEQKIAISKHKDLNILRELEAYGTPKAGHTNDKVALKIAKTLKATQNLMLKSLQAAGSSVRELPGYLIKQSHDSEKVVKVSFDDWYRYIINRLDHKKTFTESMTEGDKKEFLMKAYQDISAGKYDIADGVDAMMDFDLFNSPGQFANLDKRISSSRKLHFQSADTFFEYNQKFGKGGVYETVYNQVQHTARNVAMMERLGTNPSSSLQKHITRAERVARAHGADVYSKFQSRKSHIQNTFDGISGKTTMPGRHMMAKVGSGARSLINISHLGNTAVAATSDLAAAAAVIQSSTGKNLIETYTGLVSDFMSMLPKENRMEVARELRLAFSDMIEMQHNRFGVHEVVPGALADAEKTFFKVSGIEAQTQAGKSASALGLARQMGSYANTNYKDLPGEILSTLDRYGISENDWEIVAQARNDLRGSTVITPEKIETLELDIPESERNRLSRSVAAMYNDHANHGSPTPGPSTRAHLLGGSIAESSWGQARRFFAQFKQFPVHVMTTVLPRIASNKPGNTVRGLTDILRGRGDNVTLMNYMFGMTGLGAIVIMVTDIENGKFGRVPGFLESMRRGGALGLYTDIVIGEHVKFNRGLFDSLAGPGLSTGATIINTFNKAVTGQMGGGDIFSEIGKIGERHIPGRNIWFTKFATDRLFLYELQEALNPGRMERIEKRAEEEGSEWWLPSPTESIR